MYAANIGKFIKDRRKALNMTQAEVAERLNISPQAVSKWERRESLPDISSMPELAQVLGVRVEDIIKSGLMDDPSYSEAVEILNAFISEKIFEKILSEIKKAKTITELKISFNIMALLNNNQREEFLEILLSLEDYTVILDEIIQYLNMNQREIVIDKILADRAYESIEKIIPFVPKASKSKMVKKLLLKEEYDVIEDILPFLNREHKDLIINHFIINKTEPETAESFMPFLDTKQRRLVNEFLYERNEENE